MNITFQCVMRLPPEGRFLFNKEFSFDPESFLEAWITGAVNTIYTSPRSNPHTAPFAPRPEVMVRYTRNKNVIPNKHMKTIIVGKIDVTKVTKDRLFQGKNGAKYLDITLIEVENDKYDNDFMIVESVNKEERSRGVKGPILGNARYIRAERQPATPQAAPEPEVTDDSVPF